MKIALIRASSLNNWEMQNYYDLTKNHDLSVFVSKGRKYEKMEFEIPSHKFYCLGELFSYIPLGIKFLYRFIGDPQCLLGIENALGGFDIAHTAELGSFYSLQAVRAKRKGIIKKVVVSIWENKPHLGDEIPRRKKNKKEVIDNADLFLAVTNSSKRALLKEGVDPKKVRVLPMGVDVKKFKNINIKPKVGQKRKKTVLFVGRFVKEKGIFDLIQALNLLRNREDWNGVFVGDGPERDNIKQQIKNLYLEKNIKLVRSLSYDKMPHLYNNADILILPSFPTPNWEEQFGFVLVEAMACGVSVIATDIGGIPQVIGKAGILVPPNNFKIMSYEISKLLDNDNRRKRYAVMGRARVEKYFSSKNVSNKLERIYESLL